MLKVVPQYFFRNAGQFDHLYHDFESCILYKCLDTSNVKSDYFISSHVLTIVVKGSKIIQAVDDEPIIVRENEMIFIPKDLYMIQDIIADQGTFESWLFFFSDEVINQFTNQLNRNKVNGFKIFRENKTKLPVFKCSKPMDIVTSGILDLFPRIGKGVTQLVQPKLSEILHLMSLGDQREEFLATIHSLRKGKRNIKKFMECNFNKPLKVEDYALLTGRSLASFLRDFKSGFDTTPKQWLISKRMEKASEELKKGDVNVTQVAYNAGYDNISHFIKAFRKEFDISPKQYAIRYQQSKH